MHIAAEMHWDGSAPDPDGVETMLAANPHWPARRIESVPGACFGLAGPDAETIADRFVLSPDAVLVASARIDDAPLSGSPGEILLDLERRYGLAAAGQVIGDFTWLSWRQGEARLARDFAGTRPLLYAEVPRGLVVASTIDALLAHPDVDRTLDWDALLDWRAGVLANTGRTALAAVKAPVAGSAYRLKASGVQRHPFWDPRMFPIDPGMSWQDAVAGIRTRFLEAVRCRMTGNDAVVLSGGLDSSSVACAIRHLDPDARIRSYSMEFEGSPEADERDYQEAVVQHADLDHRSIPSAAPYDHLDRFVRLMGGPYAGPHANHACLLYDGMVADGVGTAFDGIDGDAVMGGGEALPVELLLHGRVVQALRATGAGVGPRSMWRLARRLRRGLTDSVRYQLRGQETVLGGPVLPEELRTARDRLRQDAPERTHRSWKGRHHQDRVLRPAFQDGQGRVFTRLPQSLGIDRASPFLDRRLVEFALRVPIRHRGHEGLTRLHFRQAMQGIVPAKILQRRTKGRFTEVTEQGLRDASPASLPPAWQKRFRFGDDDLGRFREAQLACLATLTSDL